MSFEEAFVDRIKRAGWQRGAAVVLVTLITGGTISFAASPLLDRQGRAADAVTGSPAARFAVLSNAHSNRCGMPASAISAMSPTQRLQGACCFPMDYRSYVAQLRALERYAAVGVIPRDPYDIQVGLAARLIAYQSIKLTPAQRATYNHAVPMAKTHGPCCCPCWRWTAFGGQAKYLITRRHYSAKQIADVWSSEEGCGGA
ncbi:MAG: hypothetical protein ACYDA3_11410 [Gaiellaceae bacterium]